MRIQFFEPPAAAAAGGVEKNAVSFLMLASGGAWPDLEAFLMPFDLVFLICVEPGLRPAPGRLPPLHPCVPTIPLCDKRVPWRCCDPKKAGRRLPCTMIDLDP